MAIVWFVLLGAFLAAPTVLTWAAARRQVELPCPVCGDEARNCCGKVTSACQVPSPLHGARREFVRGAMTLTEFEAVAENYVAGRECCPACGRFPVDGDGLCQRHAV